MSEEKVFAVFGLGTFGYEVCRVLSEKGGKVIGIDNQSTLIERIKDSITQAILLDSTNEDELKGLPLGDIDIAIVSIGESVEASIITTALLKKLQIPYIIARAVTDIHARILRQIGATEVINVEIEQGRRMAERLISPDILERIPISDNQVLAEIMLPKKLAGIIIAEADLRRKFNINVASVKRTVTDIDSAGNPVKETVIIPPEPQLRLEENDILVIIGSNESIVNLKEL